ncbi:MAG: CBS domain-containing protein [Egibacteraceae bacterium]
MKRWLYRYRTVAGEPRSLATRLRADLRGLLVAGTGSPSAPPAGDGSFRVRLPAEILGADLHKLVRVTTGVATTSGTRLRVPVTWAADPGRHAFPTFDGTIELEPLDHARAQLTIVGSYEAPANVVGAVVDRAILGGVAEGTADTLLQGLTRALAETEAIDQPVPEADASMRVADVMTSDPLVLGDDQPLRTAALLLFNFDIGGAPVVDQHGALVGVLSEADLLVKEARPRYGFGRGVQEAWRHREARTVGEACSRPAHVTAADARLRDAARELLDRDVARLVVLESSRIAGIVTRHDVLRALLRSDDAIRHAVQARVERLGEPGVAVAVEWGAVALSGTVSRLSRIHPLVTGVSAVDGVMNVDADELTWQVDDVTPLATPTI